MIGRAGGGRRGGGGDGGEVEVADGGPDQWWERLSVVPYHPAGRDAYAKLLSPQLDDIAVPALEGERQLVSRLMKVDTVSERADIMYREAEAASLALMGDPAELGPAYDPESVLAPGVNWESIAAWDSTTQAAVARRLSDAGVPVAHRTYPGQFHGFITMGKLLPKANDALREIGNWLKALG